MTHTVEGGGPGHGPEGHVDPDAVTEEFAAITADTLKDVTDRSATDRMRDERLRQTDAVAKARTALEGPFGEPKPVRGEAGPFQKAQRPSAHPEAITEPLRRYDIKDGHTAPQPALQEEDFTATQPFARVQEFPPNRAPRHENAANPDGYQGRHAGGANFEPQYPLADTKYEGKHRKTLMGRVRNGLRNGINRLRGRG